MKSSYQSTNKKSQNKYANVSTSDSIKNSNDEFVMEKLDDLNKKMLKYEKKSNNLSQLKNSSKKSQNFLKCLKWNYNNEDNWTIIENNIELIVKKFNKEDINNLIESIKSKNLEDIFNQSYSPFENPNTIGPLNSLEYLIEATYYFYPTEEEIMRSDKFILTPYIHKFRSIKGDGNCFFRGIIFYFLEYVILSKNIMLMKEILYLFNDKISLENKKIQKNEYIRENITNINIEQVSIILFIIIKYLDERINDELSAYTILLKAFLYYKEFDYGMIFFTRYLLYEYISENETKIYSKENNVELGTLLPDKYIREKNGKNEYLFQDFYKELLTMGEFIEKIGVYIAPYVLNCELNILFYNYGNEENSIKELNYKCGKYTEFEINLILRKNHYDIYYKEYFYQKFYREMDILIDNNENLIFFNSLKQTQNEFEKSKSNNNSIKNSDNENHPKNSKITLKKLNSNIISNNKNTIINSSLPISNLNNSNIKEIFSKNNINASKKKFDRKKRGATMKGTNPLTFNQFQNKPINSSNNIDNENMPKCIQCKKQYNHQENVFSLCKNCLFIELKNRILQAYLSYLERGYTKNCEKRLNNFISNIKCSISLQKNIYLNIAIKNSGYTFKYIFDEIRETMCLVCGGNIENKNYFFDLPCKCKICKKDCFDKYVKCIEDMNKMVLIDDGKEEEQEEEELVIIPFTECPCGFNYNLKAFMDIIKKLDKMNEKSYKKIFEQQIKNNWKWICMICRQNFKKKNQYFRLYLSDDNINKDLLKKFELKHLICKKCCEDNNIIKENEIKYYCRFCNSEHLIDYIKKVNSDNKTESDCIIT